MVWLLYRSRIGLSIVEEASMYSVTYCHIASNSKVLALSNNKMMNSRIDSKSMSTQGRSLAFSYTVGTAYGERGLYYYCPSNLHPDDRSIIVPSNKRDAIIKGHRK